MEPGSPPYRRSLENYYVYDETIRTPSTGLLTLATVFKGRVDDTYMYSESISLPDWADLLDTDLIFTGIFTFNALRGYELAQTIKSESGAVVVRGGLHASLNYAEACQYSDCVLLGEGEESALELVETLRHGQTPDFPGLASRRWALTMNCWTF